MRPIQWDIRYWSQCSSKNDVYEKLKIEMRWVHRFKCCPKVFFIECDLKMCGKKTFVQNYDHCEKM